MADQLTHLPCNRPSGIYILTGFSEKNVTGSENFPPASFSQVAVLPFFNHAQMIYAGYVKSRTGEATNWPRKIKNFTRYQGG